jgi:hypothetical protein
MSWTCNTHRRYEKFLKISVGKREWKSHFEEKDINGSKIWKIDLTDKSVGNCDFGSSG